MKNTLIGARNYIIHKLYTWILKPILFKFDAELIHDCFIKMGQIIGKSIITQKMTGFFFNYKNKSLEQNIAGLSFKNPIGLAAGFDKNAELKKILLSIDIIALGK